MTYFSSHIGEFAALLTALFWTITALAFESATNKVGSMAVNFIRLVIAFFILCIVSYFVRGVVLPTDATNHAWLWLAISGLVGFVFGDYFLFKSFPLITSRIAMLIMTIVPPITALLGWHLMGERMNMYNILGMTLTMIGISMAIFRRGSKNEKTKISRPLMGFLFAFLGAIGQAIGLILSKYGMRDYNFFAATQIRIIAGIFGFIILITFFRRWFTIKSTVRNRPAMTVILTGSIFGPFLGVSFSLYAVQNTIAGIAATLMAIVPVLIILPSFLIFRQKVTLMEVLGAFISVTGIALFFIE